MNNKVSTGIWLVFIGVIFLLDNFHIIDFHFLQILKFWPLLLVSMGINLLLQNRPNSTYLVVGLNILLCGFVFVKGIQHDPNQNFNINISNDELKNASFSKHVSTEYSSDIEEAVLELNGGAAKYNFVTRADSSELLSGSSSNANVQLQMETGGSSKKKIELNSSIKGSNSSKNLVEVMLNENPAWTFEFNIGAALIQGDLSRLKIKRLELNSGASKMNLTLPAPTLGTSSIEINTAASQVFLKIPKGVPCQVEYDSIISNNKLEDIDHKDGDVRKSAGYDQASNRYDIQISGAANSLTIVRY